jgi:hypothetical protein
MNLHPPRFATEVLVLDDLSGAGEWEDAFTQQEDGVRLRKGGQDSVA